MRIKEKKPLGRPKDNEKIRAIVRSAKQLFLTHGLRNVSMEKVAANANVSKMTLYAAFPNKEILFGAVIEECKAGFTLQTMKPRKSKLSSQARLTYFGVEFLKFILAPEQINLDRLVNMEANDHPDYAKTYYANGPEKIQKMAAELIEELYSNSPKKSGNKIDSLRAAEDLIGLLKGCFFMKARLHPHGAINSRDLRIQVNHAVKGLLKIYPLS